MTRSIDIAPKRQYQAVATNRRVRGIEEANRPLLDLIAFTLGIDVQ